MPLSKVKPGSNMYQGWIHATHSHLGGLCPHACSYCYVQTLEKRFKKGRYIGQLRLIEKEFDVRYGVGKTIFIEHCNDLWSDAVPGEWIHRVLGHCCKYPDNTYVFQTKNPSRFKHWLKCMPPNRLLGCTIETTLDEVAAEISKAPPPFERLWAMERLVGDYEQDVFITIEPILRGQMRRLADWMMYIEPKFVNIGADSKGTGLDEPTGDDIRLLLSELERRGIKVRQKSNLHRLLK